MAKYVFKIDIPGGTAYVVTEKSNLSGSIRITEKDKKVALTGPVQGALNFLEKRMCVDAPAPEAPEAMRVATAFMEDQKA